MVSSYARPAIFRLGFYFGSNQFPPRKRYRRYPEFSARTDAIFFIDPPYTAGGKKAGKRLYTHFSLDHDYLFSICESITGDFLMTYDNADEVKRLARRHRFQMRLIPMNNTHHATMEELVIGKALSWMDQYPAVHEPKAWYAATKVKETRSKKIATKMTR